MRRSEFEINDKALVEELFATCEHGTLCLVDEDEPYTVPLNFVWHDETICFHGSQEGRKMEVIAKNSKASFITPLKNKLKNQLAYRTFGCLKKLATF